jgi:hypothetical protein
MNFENVTFSPARVRLAKRPGCQEQSEQGKSGVKEISPDPTRQARFRTSPVQKRDKYKPAAMSAAPRQPFVETSSTAARHGTNQALRG